MFRKVMTLAAIIAAPAVAQQANDSAYTALIKQNLQDPRISTELVDHLPASATVRRRSSSTAASSVRSVN